MRQGKRLIRLPSLRPRLDHKIDISYKCGTCGRWVCVCVLAVNENREDYRVDIILQRFSVPLVAKAPSPLLKEWISDVKSLEFTLNTLVPPVPPSIVFGPFNLEREPVQMALFITSDLLLGRYGVQGNPGGDIGKPTTYARMSGKSVVFHYGGADSVLPYHLFVSGQSKIQLVAGRDYLIITCCTSYPLIRLLDEWTHASEKLLPLKAAMNTLDTWLKTNVNNQALPLSVWQDLTAVKGRSHRLSCPQTMELDRKMCILLPNLVECISYDMIKFLQAEGDIALA